MNNDGWKGKVDHKTREHLRKFHAEKSQAWSAHLLIALFSANAGGVIVTITAMSQTNIDLETLSLITIVYLVGIIVAFIAMLLEFLDSLFFLKLYQDEWCPARYLKKAIKSFHFRLIIACLLLLLFLSGVSMSITLLLSQPFCFFIYYLIIFVIIYTLILGYLYKTLLRSS